MISLRSVYQNVKNELSRQFDTAEQEARELVMAVTGVSAADLYLDRQIEFSPEQQEQLDSLLKRRLTHEPLQYLLGEWDFYGRTFAVGPGVLIPRADTETLAAVCLSFLHGKAAPRVLDLCTGSGCLSVTVASERPDAEVWAVEKSAEAWRYFCRNNETYGGKVRGIFGDVLTELPELPDSFDLILSNPPYLTADEMRDLQPEVEKEPEMALFGGEDGLFFYREITARYAGRLKPGGMLAYEIGMGQQQKVSEILNNSGLKSICQTPDLHGIIRVVSAENKFS